MSSPSSTTSTTSPPSISIPARRKSRVSAEHTLTRVRENQRRHRARRRDYIAALEIQLAETELQLEAARAEIAMLRAGHGAGSTSPNGEPRDAEDGGEEEGEMAGWDGARWTRGLVVEVGEGAGELGRTSADKHAAALNLLGARRALGADMDIETSTSTSPAPGAVPADEPPLSPECLPPPQLMPPGPPPCCTDTPPTPPLAAPDAALVRSTAAASPECTTCATRPAPSPTESTTLCSQAYMLISQQNFRQIDAATIRLWLWQGYRRAQRRGEGCRVENGVLLSVLDFISGEL